MENFIFKDYRKALKGAGHTAKEDILAPPEYGRRLYEKA